MEYYFIILIVIACLFGLYLVYKIMGCAVFPLRRGGVRLGSRPRGHRLTRCGIICDATTTPITDVIRFFKWVWKKCCKPPIDAVYYGCMRPIGHCCRDSIFVCKEGFCDCTDACERCLSPYKRI